MYRENNVTHGKTKSILIQTAERLFSDLYQNNHCKYSSPTVLAFYIKGRNAVYILPAGKGLTSWLSFVVYNCEFVTFPLVSRVRCGI